MPKLRFTMTLHLAMTLLAISALAPVPATSQDEQVGESGTASWYPAAPDPEALDRAASILAKTVES